MDFSLVQQLCEMGFGTSTGMSTYNNLLNDKEMVYAWGKEQTMKDYYRDHKGMAGEVKFVSPDKYIDDCVNGWWMEKRTRENYAGYKEAFRQAVIKSRSQNRENIERLKRVIADAEGKMDLPTIEYYDDGTITQEGIHRALAAKELGLKEIPVVYVNEKYRKN
jgi:hypothetical protein